MGRDKQLILIQGRLREQGRRDLVRKQAGARNHRFRAIACDYDGTLADEGCVAPATLSMLQAARAEGSLLILITGRRLDDLKTVFLELPLFDVVVAENGATVFHPESNTEEPLCAAPPSSFLERLRQCKVPYSVGRRVIASVRPYDTSIGRVIQELKLDLQVILNRESVMVLPSGIDKASGLLAALQKTGFDPSLVVGFGDAENDVSFLKLCGMSVAVANAIEALKEEVDVVTTRNDGAGVAEIIERLVAEKRFRN